MSDTLMSMLAQLSDEDKVIFKQLSDKLKQVNGDVSQLQAEELSLIQLMQKKYDHAINQIHLNQADQQNQPEEESLNILEMPFSEHVRQILARDLRERFPQEEDAINFVFENKWLPLDYQNNQLIEQLYTKFEMDIIEINQWRNDLVEIESDKKMALGLAWFMVIFQLHKRASA